MAGSVSIRRTHYRGQDKRADSVRLSYGDDTRGNGPEIEHLDRQRLGVVEVFVDPERIVVHLLKSGGRAPDLLPGVLCLWSHLAQMRGIAHRKLLSPHRMVASLLT